MAAPNGPVTWAVVGSLGERLARLEDWRAAQTAGSATRSTRVGVLVVGLVTGVVCPLVVTSLLAWLHLRGT